MSRVEPTRRTAREVNVEAESEGDNASHSRVSRNALRADLHALRQLVATFVMIPRLEIVEMAAAADFNALVFDLEHGAITVEDLPALCAAARAGGVATLARLAGHTEVEIGRALDMGVEGVIVPHVSSPAIAAAVVAGGRFPPDGCRSLNPYVRGLDYDGTRKSALAEANASTALIAMIEGADALSLASEIGAVEGIDALFVGPVDLAGTLGFPGQPEHPKVVQVTRELIQTLRGKGVPTAIYAPDVAAAQRWLQEGVGLVVVSADHALVAKAFSSLRSEISGVSTAT